MRQAHARVVLEPLASASAERARRARRRRSLEDLRRVTLGLPPGRAPQLSPSGFDVIAEVKLASPSAGRLARSSDGASIAKRAACYAGAGACAISVLTEPERFGGALVHVGAARRGASVAVLRKDFLVDPYQVWEARAAGADGVLLIARILDDDGLDELVIACERARAFALIEAFDAEDLERIGRALERRIPRVPVLLGVNCRDLATLEVDLSRLESLARLVPAGFPKVAESGLSLPEDARRVARAGFDLALVGTSLMRSRDPGGALAMLLAAGRRGREEAACPSW